jgi:hypothetical protein
MDHRRSDVKYTTSRFIEDESGMLQEVPGEAFSDNHDGRCLCGAVTPCEEQVCDASPGHEYTCPECLRSDSSADRAYRDALDRACGYAE